MALRVRTKKLIGTVFVMIWLPVYLLLAWVLSFHVLPHANGFVQFLYYAVAGTAWIVPIGLMLPWMSRDPQERMRPSKR